MQINNSYGHLATILDYLDSDSSDNSIESILTQNSNNRIAMMRHKLGMDETSTASSRSILNAAETVEKSLDSLLATTDDSVFVKAAASADTSDIISRIQNIVSGYNSLVKNMSSQGGQVNITYLAELGKRYVDNQDALEAIGITRNDNGQLIVDTDKLKAADLKSLQSLFNGSGSYASSISDTIQSIRKVTASTSALSSVYSSNYGSDGVSDDLTTSLLDSLFNSKA